MRVLPNSSPKCCIEPLAMAMEHMCFAPEVRKEYIKLLRRYQGMTTKSKRIWALAEPKYRANKYLTPCFCPEIPMQRVEILREGTPRTRTRTEQLSYPTVGRLLGLRDHDSFQSFSNDRKSAVNRLLRKSMLSLYSRLANVQPPTKKEKPKKLDELEYELHLKRWKELAKPRVQKEETKPKAAAHPKKRSGYGSSSSHGGGIGISGSHYGGSSHGIHGVRSSHGGSGRKTSRRLKALCKPKVHEEAEPKEWKLTPSLKNYTPTDRILRMAVPRTYEPFDPESPYRIKETALNYKASERIKELALPSVFYQKPEIKDAPYTTNPNALKGKASKRVIELAEPKSYSDNHSRANPFTVSRKALHAKITPRLLQLAQPKTYANN